MSEFVRIDWLWSHSRRFPMLLFHDPVFFSPEHHLFSDSNCWASAARARPGPVTRIEVAAHSQEAGGSAAGCSCHFSGLTVWLLIGFSVKQRGTDTDSHQSSLVFVKEEWSHVRHWTASVRARSSWLPPRLLVRLQDGLHFEGMEVQPPASPGRGRDKVGAVSPQWPQVAGAHTRLWNKKLVFALIVVTSDLVWRGCSPGQRT